MADTFLGIMVGKPIPEDWRCGQVILVPKKGGDAGLLCEYRPLTVTSVLHRTFAHILKTWMGGWAEHDDKLSELQNGFHSRRRLEDNVFVLTQTIEIARKENRGLYSCFLDVAKAYDSVPHGPLFHCMTQIGMPRTWVSLQQRLYTDNTVVACFDEAQVVPVTAKRGLKQGRPLSPLLYMLYTASLEGALLADGA